MEGSLSNPGDTEKQVDVTRKLRQRLAAGQTVVEASNRMAGEQLSRRGP